MSLIKTRVGVVASGLKRPFEMHQIARVDHFGVMLYLCQGFVARHYHVTQDELFYVHSGVFSVESDWGKASLSSDEVTVIPRGLHHRTGAVLPAIVLRLQALSDSERKNGHGRLAAEEQRHTQPKQALFGASLGLTRPYQIVSLGQVDEMSLRAVLCRGATPWHGHLYHDELLWVRQGQVSLSTPDEDVTLAEDELVVVPRGTPPRQEAEQALAVSLMHAETSPEAHMGLNV
jgi:mannose-6-phosphate isomerase-like protein (cupin superfamily)